MVRKWHGALIESQGLVSLKCPRMSQTLTVNCETQRLCHYASRTIPINLRWSINAMVASKKRRTIRPKLKRNNIWCHGQHQMCLCMITGNPYRMLTPYMCLNRKGTPWTWPDCRVSQTQTKVPISNRPSLYESFTDEGVTLLVKQVQGYLKQKRDILTPGCP